MPQPLRAEESDKRSAILAAALDLFAERGYYGTAVPEVADRAGVGAGTIYRYFKSKEDLVNTLYRQWKAALGSHVLQQIKIDSPAREQFHQFWTALGHFMRNNPKVFGFLELHHHGSYLDEESRGMEQRVLDMASAFVSRLQAQRIFKPVAPDVLMAIAYWSFVGLGRCAQEGRIVLDDETLAAAEQCVWEAIRY